MTRTSFRIAWRAVCLLVAIAAVPAFAGEWRGYEYAADGFAVEFNGKVKIAPIDVSSFDTSKLDHATGYLQDDEKRYAFVVAASLFKKDVDIELGVKGTMDRYKCAVIETDISLPGMGDRAREIRATQCAGGKYRVGIRFVVVGRWFYQICYLIADETDRADAERFLKSFRLLARPA